MTPAVSHERDRAPSRQQLTLSLALAAALVLLAFAAPHAQAAGSRAPRNALLHAQAGVRTLASQASTSSSGSVAGSASRALSAATAPALWIDSHDSVAPAYGSQIFTDSGAAIADLQGLRSSRARSAIGEIVTGLRGLAASTINRARGSNSPLLAKARRALARGARQAAGSNDGAAARSLFAAWKDAFGALTKLISGAVTSMPAADLAAGAENALGSSKIGLSGPHTPHGLSPLRKAGKPELLFIGAEGCPFCGIERWGMIVALSQFGSFSNLHLMQSFTLERPAVTGFTFAGSKYTSPYISFVPVEALSNVRQGRSFAHLQPLSHLQTALLKRFDQQFETPFIDVANRFITVQSTVQPSLLGGLYWTQVAASLTQPDTVPAQAVAGEAEVVTAELCEATNGKPAAVCSSPVVAQYEAALPLLDGHGGGCPIAAPAPALADFEFASPPVAQADRCHT